jgi:OPA family sugar phosphate sensor protein UhpC-like MFS transporter
MASIVIAALTGASNTVLLFLSLYALQGFAQSTGWSACSKNLSAFFSQRERGRVIGWWCTSYAAGGFLGNTLAGYMAERYGWPYAFWAPAGILLFIWLLILVFQRNRPEDVGLPSIEQYHAEPEAVVAEDETPAEEREGSWHVIQAVLQNRMVLLLGLVYFLVKMPRYLFFNWAPVYIDAQLGTGTFKSSLLGGLYDIATPFAVLFGGYVSDKIFRSKRMPLSILGLIGSAILMLSFSGLPATALGLGLGLFGIGFLLNIPDSLVSGTAAIDFGTKKGASTAAGFINGMGSVGAIIGGTLPGWIQKVIGPDRPPWPYTFAVMGVALALAAVLLIPKWNELPPTEK